MEKYAKYKIGRQLAELASCRVETIEGLGLNYVAGEGMVVVVNGKPGAGKSTFAICASIAHAAINPTKQVGYFQWDFTLDMFIRATNMFLGHHIDHNQVREWVSGLENYYTTTDFYLEDVLAFISQCAPGSMVCVDYLQRIRCQNPPKGAELGHEYLRHIMFSLQTAALKSRVIVVVISSMNRESLKLKKNTEDDHQNAGSGSASIEYSADALISLLGFEARPLLAWDVVQGKNRRGVQRQGKYKVKLHKDDFAAFFSKWDLTAAEAEEQHKGGGND